MMRKNIFGLLLLSQLSACAGWSAHPSRDAGGTTAWKSQARNCPDAEAVLSSLRRSRDGALPGKEACAAERLRYVAQQWLNGESRIEPLRGQLDKANEQLRQEPAEDLSGLSMLLGSLLSERKRHEEALQRSNAQLAEQQHRAEELAAKLEALRLIEQSMVNKASKKKIQP
jgi:chromosome segregation ATPase